MKRCATTHSWQNTESVAHSEVDPDRATEINHRLVGHFLFPFERLPGRHDVRRDYGVPCTLERVIPQRPAQCLVRKERRIVYLDVKLQTD
jgi:hypothetical protein